MNQPDVAKSRFRRRTQVLVHHREDIRRAKGVEVERLLDGDAVRDYDGVEVVVDKMSVPYLSGASIDFEDTISKQGFTIDNPNAGGSCACGDSFH